MGETIEPGTFQPTAETGPSGGRLKGLLGRRIFLRLALTALALVVLGGLAYLTVSADGFIRRSELEREKRKLETEIEVLRDENQNLRQRIEHLRHDPGYVEDEARRKLGLILPGETVYRLSEEPDLTKEGP